MGIRHLAQLLQPYAVSTLLGCKTKQCKSHRIDSAKSTRSIIIDGPAFAYQVYYKILGEKPDVLNAFDAVPTYTETGIAFLTYLEELESYGLVMYVSALPVICSLNRYLAKKSISMATCPHVSKRPGSRDWKVKGKSCGNSKQSIRKEYRFCLTRPSLLRPQSRLPCS